MQVEYRGTKFKKKQFLKSEEPYAFVLKISQIILNNENAILILEKIENFDKTYHCFIIGDSMFG